MRVVFLIGVAALVPHSHAQPQIPRYDLSVQIFPAERRLRVEGSVTLPPQTEERSARRLQLDQRLQKLEMTVIEPHEYAGPMTISRAPPNVVLATLPKPVPAGVALRLEFRYEGEEGWTSQFYVGPDGVYLGEGAAWYPLPFGVRRATGTLRFTAPREFTVVANGLKRSRATASPLSEFEVQQPNAFAFVAGRYVAYESQGKPPVAIYSLHRRPDPDQRLRLLRKVIHTLEREFGPYPYAGFAFVEVPTAAAGSRGNAASLSGFVAAAENNLEHFNLAVLAHEIGHAWWGNCLADASSRGAGMLSEALAQYAALRVAENLHGEKAAAEFR